MPRKVKPEPISSPVGRFLKDTLMPMVLGVKTIPLPPAPAKYQARRVGNFHVPVEKDGSQHEMRGYAERFKKHLSGLSNMRTVPPDVDEYVPPPRAARPVSQQRSQMHPTRMPPVGFDSDDE